MEALALKFKTKYHKIFIYKPKFSNGNVIKINNYINIYKHHRK
jgi:hypothetical protein